MFLTPSIVVSTKRLVLWRSEIFGGISNEINVILDQSTLLKDLEGGKLLGWDIFAVVVPENEVTEDLQTDGDQALG